MAQYTLSPRLIIEALQEDPAGVARSAAAELRQMFRIQRLDGAIVFGTGWDPAVHQLGPKLFEFPATRLAGFLPPTVEGHAGKIRIVEINGLHVLVFRGRKHLYEFPYGQGVEAVTHYVRVAKELGCRFFFHTNAVGGLDPSYRIGQLVMASGHNKLITGVPPVLRGPQFLESTKMHNPRLRRLCRRVDPNLAIGTYTQVHGSDFETEDDALYLWKNGISIVGMSGIPEATIAKQLKLPFALVSVVTDVAGTKVSHHDVQRVVHRNAPRFGRFLEAVISQI